MTQKLPKKLKKSISQVIFNHFLKKLVEFSFFLKKKFFETRFETRFIQVFEFWNSIFSSLTKKNAFQCMWVVENGFYRTDTVLGCSTLKLTIKYFNGYKCGTFKF